jgi:5-methylcytosine-specific restriction endonuclease McrA
MSDPCSAKSCSQCGEAKPTRAFANRRASRDGLSAYCKACSRAKYTTPEKKAEGKRRRGEISVEYKPRAQRMAEAAEKRAARKVQAAIAAAERASRPRKPALGSLQWYASATAEQVAIYRRAMAAKAQRYYAANRTKARAKVKRWKRANPELVARHMADRAAREDANADGSITRPAKAKLLASATHCGYCAARLDPTRTHFDHTIPLAKGGAHRIENLVVCCSACNLSKGARTPWEWAAAGARAA